MVTRERKTNPSTVRARLCLRKKFAHPAERCYARVEGGTPCKAKAIHRASHLRNLDASFPSQSLKSHRAGEKKIIPLQQMDEETRETYSSQCRFHFCLEPGLRRALDMKQFFFNPFVCCLFKLGTRIRVVKSK